MNSIEEIGRSPPGRLPIADFQKGWGDLCRGIGLWEYWSQLGWFDILQRYRRSTLGPFWITMSMGITVVALGVLYPQLLSIPVGDYLPFLAISFVAWTFISALITESCTAFIAGEGIIKQAAIPLSVHIFRLIWRNLIVLAHNCVIFIVIAAAMGLSMGWPALAGFCGLALVTLLVFPVGLILAALCARFRDIPPMVASLVQLAFFITPVLWSPRMMPEGRLFILTFNPFYHVMTVIRDPFLGNMVAFDSWGVVAALTVLAWMAALFLIGRLGHRVPYWL